jgi:Sec-independent protein translocase protein TatA
VGGDLLFVLIIVLIIVLVVRGPKTLPQLGAMFGRGVKEARREVADIRAKRPDDKPPSGSAG